MTKASFVPTTATSRGLSAWATAGGRTRAASSVTSAIRVVMPGLYDSFGRSDLSEADTSRDQTHSEQERGPEPQPGERKRCCAADLLGRREHALRATLSATG